MASGKSSRRNQERVLFVLMGLIIIGLIISGYFLFVRKILPELSAHKVENPLLANNSDDSTVVEKEEDAEFIPENEAVVIKLFFGKVGEDSLVTEARRVRRRTMLSAQAQQIVENILIGPKKQENCRILPLNTELRGLFFESGTFIIDLSEEFAKIRELGAAEETMAVYSVVNALTELDARARVKFLINGTEPISDSGHIDLSATLTRLPSLIQ
ncbi:MAG: GerMN domain-containing protein [Candidatus Riflebacteria bacterium]|nr:GerMN domain-containing protein [Candidatus Riflebacteria bacterium]